MSKEKNLKNALNPLHSKKYYQSSDTSLLLIQAEHLEKLYEFNSTRPSENDKREALLKEMFGSIGENCYIEPPLHANWGGKHVFFGDNIYANFNLTLVDDTFIYVGSYTKFAPNVIVATASHPSSAELRDQAFQVNLPVKIGKSCWIGSGAIILPGVTIGDNTIIGAGSIVTKDIPANVIAVGNPCKVLRPITEKDYLDAQNNMF